MSILEFNISRFEWENSKQEVFIKDIQIHDLLELHSDQVVQCDSGRHHIIFSDIVLPILVNPIGGFCCRQLSHRMSHRKYSPDQVSESGAAPGHAPGQEFTRGACHGGRVARGSPQAASLWADFFHRPAGRINILEAARADREILLWSALAA